MKRKQSRKSDGMNLEDVLGAYYDLGLRNHLILKKDGQL
jgi:hypothetical protein